MSTALINLVDMYRSLGKTEEALEAAQRIGDADPTDGLAALDVAELNLELGRHADAAAAFERLRGVVDVPEHEVAALHGLVKVEMSRGDLKAALAYAREARAIDTVGRTRGVLAHLESEIGGGEALEALARDASAAMMAAIEAPPSRDQVEQALTATLLDVRQEWAGGLRG
jgi:tetratricopeptide (TPR) repeat protein